MQTLKNYLRVEALKRLDNNVTVSRYKQNIDKFAEWAKTEKRIKDINKVTEPRELLQQYVVDLDSRGYSPATIHTYIAPVCRGFGIEMKEIKKPKRTASTVTRTRTEGANERGIKDMAKPENSRLVEFQRAVGIRRDELRRLTGKNLKVDVNGHLCVEVEKGKGGKYQLQYILPQDTEIVKTAFADVSLNERVFSDKEIKSSHNMPLHALRRDHAQEAYKYYVDRIKNGDARLLKAELMKYFDTYHKRDTKDPERFRRQRMKFQRDIMPRSGSDVYVLRGENKERAIAMGKPTEYSRTALMCVSVFHLAHWRLDVTVVNYML